MPIFMKRFITIVKIVLYVYMALVLILTQFRTNTYPRNIDPLFYEARLIITTMESWAIKDTILNIFMLMPMGFLLPIIYLRYRKVQSVAMSAFLFSLSIETIQLITTRGTCQMDDLMNNTIGAVIGFCIWKRCMKMIK